MNYIIQGFSTKADFNKKKVGFTDSRKSKKLALEYVEILRSTGEFHAALVTNESGTYSETFMREEIVRTDVEKALHLIYTIPLEHRIHATDVLTAAAFHIHTQLIEHGKSKGKVFSMVTSTDKGNVVFTLDSDNRINIEFATNKKTEAKGKK